MLLQQIQAAFLAILSLAVGGYAPWSDTYSQNQEPAGPGLKPASAPIVGAPTPGYTPLPEAMTGVPATITSDLGRPPAQERASRAASPADAGLTTGPVSLQGTQSGPAATVRSSFLPPDAASVEYFVEIGMGAEYGDSEPVLHKWTRDLRISIHGNPGDADVKALEGVVSDLNDLVGDVDIRLTDGEGNVDIYFLPESRFTSVEPNYVPVNLGFFRVWWDSNGAINRARILISTRGITQQERAHLIREELTQSLGLFQDSWKHQDSIFYQGWTATIHFSDLDRAAIRLLYDSRLKPGMQPGEVLAALNNPQVD